MKKKSAINDRIVHLAYELERAACDANLDLLRVTYESSEFALYGRSGMRVFAIDSEGRSHLWKEGGEDSGC